jgi:uncharacterized protein (DUF1684 family)
MASRTKLPWLLLLIALTVACGAFGSGSMVPLLPPGNWEAALLESRSIKDEAFRESPDTPLVADDVEEFAGLQYWAPDSEYYYAGPIHVYATKQRFDIVTTSGRSRPCEKFGWIEFPVGGSPQQLQVYRLLDIGDGSAGAESLLVPFTDGTTGEETYPAGRYVDLMGPTDELPVTSGPDDRPISVGPYVLDFNRAYNPSCAYGAPERFACPVTPAENRLQTRIEAGERGFKLPPPAQG